jgi:hypothetical protein
LVLEQSIVHAPSHAKVQPPPEQLKLQVSPFLHHAEQVPPEQSRLHGTFSAQTKKHLPPEQFRLQLLSDSHSILHAPPEQSTLHPLEPPHSPSHCPAEQLQLPCASHETGVCAFPVGRGSGRAGAELHAAAISSSRPGPTTRRKPRRGQAATTVTARNEAKRIDAL